MIVGRVPACTLRPVDPSHLGCCCHALSWPGIDSRCKSQDPTATGELFAKDRFDINVVDDTVTWPAGVIVAIAVHRRGGGQAQFGAACA